MGEDKRSSPWEPGNQFLCPSFFATPPLPSSTTPSSMDSACDQLSTTASPDRRPENRSKRGKKGQQNPQDLKEEVAFYVSSHKKLPHTQEPETPAYHCFIIVITLLSPPHRQPLRPDSAFKQEIGSMFCLCGRERRLRRTERMGRERKSVVRKVHPL